MSHTTKTCPACGQTLRIPEGLGGVAMACPNCGRRIASFFKLGGVKSPSGRTNQASPPSAPKAPHMPDIPSMPELANMAVMPAGKDMPDQEEVQSPRTPLLTASGLTRYKLMMRQG